MAKINFFTGDRKFNFQQKQSIKDFIEQIFKKEKKELQQITYVFCSDKFLLKMNTEFLHHDYYTDIITFGLSDKNKPVEAEIYISIDRVKDNAKQLGLPYKTEMLRVLFHGALHLCGYKDKTKSEILNMRVKEERFLLLYYKSQ